MTSMVDTEVYRRIGSRTKRELTADQPEADQPQVFKAEARRESKGLLIQKYSELGELGVSVVKKKSEKFDTDWN